MLEYLQHRRHDNFWMWIWAVERAQTGAAHLFSVLLRDMQLNLIVSLLGFTDIMRSLAYFAFGWHIQHSTSSARLVILFPEYFSLKPLPTSLSSFPLASFLPSSCAHTLFLSSPPTFLKPHTKWRVTVCNVGFVLEKSSAPQTLMHTDGGRDRH